VNSGLTQTAALVRLLLGYASRVFTYVRRALLPTSMSACTSSAWIFLKGSARRRGGHRSSIDQRIARAPATTRVFPQDTPLDEALDITERGVVRALLELRPLRCRQLPGKAVR
jgi:hypothetical protein